MDNHILNLGEDGWISEIREKIDSEPEFMHVVQELKMWNFGCSAIYCDDLAVVLRGCPKLKVFTFGYNNMGDAGFDDDVCDSLAGLADLEAVNIETVNLGNEGMERLAKALGKCAKLTRINFSCVQNNDSDWNLDSDEESDLSSKGLIALFREVQKLPLKEIDMSYVDRFDQASIDALAASVKPPLVKLNLVGADVSKLNLDKLIDAIAGCSSLVIVEVSGIDFSTAQTQRLAAGLERMPKLARFKYGSYETTIEQTLTVLRALVKCPGLKEFETSSYGDDATEAQVTEVKNLLLELGKIVDKLSGDLSWMGKHMTRDERKAAKDPYLTDSDDDSSY